MRARGLRHARYRGIEKVRLNHSLVATALNYARAGEWFSGTARAAPRVSPFAGLMVEPTAAA